MLRRVREQVCYGAEALAGSEAALWLAAESLTLEQGGEPLSRYDVKLVAATGERESYGFCHQPQSGLAT